MADAVTDFHPKVGTSRVVGLAEMRSSAPRVLPGHESRVAGAGRRPHNRRPALRSLNPSVPTGADARPPRAAGALIALTAPASQSAARRVAEWPRRGRRARHGRGLRLWPVCEDRAELRPVADSKFAIRVAQVPLNGLDGHELVLGNLPVRHSGGGHLGNAPFAGS